MCVSTRTCCWGSACLCHSSASQHSMLPCPAISMSVEDLNSGLHAAQEVLYQLSCLPRLLYLITRRHLIAFSYCAWAPVPSEWQLLVSASTCASSASFCFSLKANSSKECDPFSFSSSSIPFLCALDSTLIIQNPHFSMDVRIYEILNSGIISYFLMPFPPPLPSFLSLSIIPSPSLPISLRSPSFLPSLPSSFLPLSFPLSSPPLAGITGFSKTQMGSHIYFRSCPWPPSQDCLWNRHQHLLVEFRSEWSLSGDVC